MRVTKWTSFNKIVFLSVRKSSMSFHKESDNSNPT